MAKPLAPGATNTEVAHDLGLDEAHELREQLKPAFAGYLTDGNVSDRDVLATLMDLIAREYIGMEAETQKKPVVIKKIYQLNGKEGLLNFESKFIDSLFSGRKELRVEEVAEAVSSQRLHRIIMENLKELQKAKIMSSRLVLLDKTGKVFRIGLRGGVELTVAELERNISGMKQTALMLGGLAAAGISLYSTIALSGQTVKGSLWVGMFVCIFCAVFMLTMLVKMRRLTKILVFQFENNVVPFAKGKYEGLFEFISGQPLDWQRVHNEFMPFAVAFGLDTSWNKSFGVPTEAVVKSKAEKS